MDRQQYYHGRNPSPDDFKELQDKIENSINTHTGETVSYGLVVFSNINSVIPSGNNSLTMSIYVPALSSYDLYGKKIAIPNTATLSVSKVGYTTPGVLNASVTSGAQTTITIPTTGLYKYITVLLQPATTSNTPRKDKYGSTVNFNLLESFRFEIREGTSSATPTPPAYDYTADGILICDIKIGNSATGDPQTITSGMIDTTRQTHIYRGNTYSVGHNPDGTHKEPIDIAYTTNDHTGGNRGPKLQQANTHESVDTDAGASSIHHTIGPSATQVAAGTGTYHTSFALDLDGSSDPPPDQYFRVRTGWDGILEQAKFDDYIKYNVTGSDRFFDLADSGGLWKLGKYLAGDREYFVNLTCSKPFASPNSNVFITDIQGALIAQNSTNPHEMIGNLHIPNGFKIKGISGKSAITGGGSFTLGLRSVNRSTHTSSVIDGTLVLNSGTQNDTRTFSTPHTVATATNTYTIEITTANNSTTIKLYEIVLIIEPVSCSTI